MSAKYGLASYTRFPESQHSTIADRAADKSADALLELVKLMADVNVTGQQLRDARKKFDTALNRAYADALDVRRQREFEVGFEGMARTLFSDTAPWKFTGHPGDWTGD